DWLARAVRAGPGAAAEGEYVFLEVRDSGPGMPADVLARACEPFYTTKFPGRGLGLAAVLGIARGHGGAVRIDSEPGQGTAVTVLLPPAADALAAAPPPEPGPAGRAGTVLVVDDDPAVREVACRMLE